MARSLSASPLQSVDAWQALFPGGYPGQYPGGSGLVFEHLDADGVVLLDGFWPGDYPGQYPGSGNEIAASAAQPRTLTEAPA